mmetsp:Transcript_13287/g.17516  ORF Transcript_13287/g.17516 Transcript_13287/m.17516 type:complete len:103 (-) Transcript_13287:51-359(-)
MPSNCAFDDEKKITHIWYCLGIAAVQCSTHVLYERVQGTFGTKHFLYEQRLTQLRSKTQTYNNEFHIVTHFLCLKVMCVLESGTKHILKWSVDFLFLSQNDT